MKIAFVIVLVSQMQVLVFFILIKISLTRTQIWALTCILIWTQSLSWTRITLIRFCQQWGAKNVTLAMAVRVT